MTLANFIDSGSSHQASLGGSNQLTINEIDIRERITFLDYIMGGCKVNVHVAVDFTMSNGDPRSQDSLHYLNPRTQTNHYTEAINSVVSIL